MSWVCPLIEVQPFTTPWVFGVTLALVLTVTAAVRTVRCFSPCDEVALPGRREVSGIALLDGQVRLDTLWSWRPVFFACFYHS